MGLGADAGAIPSPRRMPWARSVRSDRKGAQAIRPMGFRTVLGPDAVWGAPDPVVEQAGKTRPILGSVKVMPRRGRAQA